MKRFAAYFLFMGIILTISGRASAELYTFTDRTTWEAAITEKISNENFESDPASCAPIILPYTTSHGLLLEGPQTGVLICKNRDINGRKNLTFRDFSPSGVGIGLSFTFPNGSTVKACGFDCIAGVSGRESWNLQINGEVLTLPTEYQGFIGVISTTLFTSFVLSCEDDVQGGITIDDISYVDSDNLVSITAPDPTASRAAFSTGVFKISRSGDTSKPLKVEYTIGGTATNGKDYRKRKTFLVIPEGESSGTILVKPKAYDLQEGDKTVILKLNNSSAYATVTIVDDN